MTPYITAVLASTIFAILLETDLGRELSALPFVTVPVGGALIFSCLFPLLPLEQWLMVVFMSIVTGVPFFVRGLINYARDSRTARETMGEGWNGEAQGGPSVSRKGNLDKADGNIERAKVLLGKLQDELRSQTGVALTANIGWILSEAQLALRDITVEQAPK